jgi:dihydroxyacid dehydratase/phosphogluconate dehydratase
MAAAPASARRSSASTRSRKRTPVLANMRPSGKYLMEDFYYAGGLRALLAARRPARPRLR